MGDSLNYTMSHTVLPDFLAELLQTEGDVLLVHNKTKKTRSACNGSFREVNVSVNNSTLNLTGSPLEVDLNVLPETIVSPLLEISHDEELYTGLKLEAARNILNKLNEGSELKLKPVYCLCDGKNEENVVVLGTCYLEGNIIRTLVFNTVPTTITYLQNNINSIIVKHMEDDEVTKATTKIMCQYEVYGSRLSAKDDLNYRECTGSIFIEGTWSTTQYEIPEHGASVKMLLQVITGHHNSNLNIFFQELDFIQSCLDILASKSDLNEAVINTTSSVDFCELNLRISKALREVDIVKLSFTSNSLQDTVENLHKRGLLNKLWNIFKGCEKVSDLRQCFDILFETATSTPIRLQITDEEKLVTLGKIINDICSGTLVVSCLSPKQCLELLIELGIQLLKQKCFDLVKSCEFSTDKELNQLWNQIESATIRNRRETCLQLNATQARVQLHFVERVCVMLEFVQLVQQNSCFSKTVSINILKRAFSKYFTGTFLNELLPAKQRTLQDLEVPLSYADVKQTDLSNLIKWRMTVTTSQKYSSTTRIMHYSKKPVLPAEYIEDCDTDSSNKESNDKYYLTRIEIYKDKVF